MAAREGADESIINKRRIRPLTVTVGLALLDGLDEEDCHLCNATRAAVD